MVSIDNNEDMEDLVADHIVYNYLNIYLKNIWTHQNGAHSSVCFTLKQLPLEALNWGFLVYQCYYERKKITYFKKIASTNIVC